MSGESSGASSGYTPSSSMPTMADTSSPSSTPSLVLSTSEPPPVTSFAMSTTSDGMSTTSVISDSSPPSISGSSTDATTPATSTDASYFSSLYPGTSPSPPQISTSIEQAQTTSTVPSIMTSANKNVSGLPTIGGGSFATSTQTSPSGNSFFNDRGAVAGTFVVVAIVFAAILACLCYAWRRRLQRRNRNELFKSITRPRGDQGLQAEPGDQPTTSMPSDSTSKPNYRTYRGDALLHSISAEEMQTAGISAPATRSDYLAKDHISRDLTGMAITTDLRPDSPVPSLTPSTPSMYPPSLPPMETESNVIGSTVYSTPFLLPSTSPPPRPPRQKRPPPPLSWKLTETAAMPSITATLVLDHPTRANVRSDGGNTSF